MDWPDLFKLAYGRLRLTPDQFFDLTVSEFNYMILGYYDEIREREQSAYERERWAVVNLLNAWTEKPIRRVQELAIFNWEKEYRTPVSLSQRMTQEARERLEKAMDKF